MTTEQKNFLIICLIVCTLFSLVETVVLYVIGFTKVNDVLYQLILLGVLDSMQVGFMMLLQRFRR